MAKKITEKRLYNIALYYLSRYESTAEKLRGVLHRRVEKARLAGEEINPSVDEWIENIISDTQKQGFVDDRRFAMNNIERWFSVGKSLKYIKGKLCQAGVSVQVLFDFEAETQKSLCDWEKQSAHIFVRKKKLGPYRPLEEQSVRYSKDLASMARAGFSLSVAQKSLKSD